MAAFGLFQNYVIVCAIKYMYDTMQYIGLARIKGGRDYTFV